MSKRMLIDASRVDETRVVSLDGNRIEVVDFEDDSLKQIKSNVYLARVTRVEASLQAAFVDFGGDRHGFLPFSEIHPDYYQIPAADREALISEAANRLAERQAAREKAREQREAKAAKAKKKDAAQAESTGPFIADEDQGEEQPHVIDILAPQADDQPDLHDGDGADGPALAAAVDVESVRGDEEFVDAALEEAVDSVLDDVLARTEVDAEAEQAPSDEAALDDAEMDLGDLEKLDGVEAGEDAGQSEGEDGDTQSDDENDGDDAGEGEDEDDELEARSILRSRP